MSANSILVVDDEQRMRKLVKDYLVREGYRVLEAEDGNKALELFFQEENANGISLVILDVMMPGLDGWQVLSKIRETSRVPVIMLTARSDERDELRGFDLGVDEYVTKPFSPRTLTARVGALLRRTMGAAAEKTLDYQGIRMDKEAHIVTIDGAPVDLSFKEFELLQYFMENRGIALSRERILNRVWNYDYYGDARTIDTHVKKLRSKLGDKASLIKTVWGIGYKFE